MQTVTAERCAERGARLLDKQQPGWARKVDLDRLNIDHPSHCVVGQLVGWESLDSLTSTPFKDGFLADDGDYDLLTDAWTEQIEARRNGHPAG